MAETVADLSIGDIGRTVTITTPSGSIVTGPLASIEVTRELDAFILARTCWIIVPELTVGEFKFKTGLTAKAEVHR